MSFNKMGGSENIIYLFGLGRKSPEGIIVTKLIKKQMLFCLMLFCWVLERILCKILVYSWVVMNLFLLIIVIKGSLKFLEFFIAKLIFLWELPLSFFCTVLTTNLPIQTGGNFMLMIIKIINHIRRCRFRAKKPVLNCHFHWKYLYQLRTIAAVSNFLVFTLILLFFFKFAQSISVQ